MKARFTLATARLLAVVGTLLLGALSTVIVQAAAVSITLLLPELLSRRHGRVIRWSWPITIVLRMRS